MFKPYVDYSMDTTVPHSKRGEIEAVKMAKKGMTCTWNQEMWDNQSMHYGSKYMKILY